MLYYLYLCGFLLNSIHNYIKTITSNKTAKIFIIEDFMTTALGKKFEQLGDILFISDIRTTINDRAPSNLDILWNHAQQYNWIKSMNPLLWIVKFRTTFFDDNNLNNDSYNAISENEIVQNDFNEAITNGIDFIANYKKKKFVFFDGTMYLQCFPGYKSTETRLVSDKMEIREYDLNDYESRLYYYNTIKRGYQLHENNNAGVVEGFDYCNCCAKENYLWKEYLITFSCKLMIFIFCLKLASLAKNFNFISKFGSYSSRGFPSDTLPTGLKSLLLSKLNEVATGPSLLSKN